MNFATENAISSAGRQGTGPPNSVNLQKKCCTSILADKMNRKKLSYDYSDPGRKVEMQ